MGRPKSIVMFERCYLVAFAAGALSTVLLWSTVKAGFAAQEALVGTWLLPVSTVIGLFVQLLLWYFIAHRGSAVAKWIATVLAAIGLAGAIFSLAIGRYPGGIGGMIGTVKLALQIAAIWFLFRPDTQVWFGEKRAENI